MFLILALIYCIVPIDLLPGPIDDTIFLFLSLLAQAKAA